MFFNALLAFMSLQTFYKLLILTLNIHQIYNVIFLLCTYENGMFQVGHEALLESDIRADAVQNKVRHVLRTVAPQQRPPEVINTGLTLNLTTTE